MRKLRMGLPSPAMIVALAALFVALGGTVYAASKINGKTIKTNSIPGNRLKNNSVTGTQINAGSLGKVPVASTADAVGTLDYRQVDFNVPAGSPGLNSKTIDCPSGLKATGGGGKANDPFDTQVVGSYPKADRSGWIVDGRTTSGGAELVTAYVVCTAASKTTP